MVQEQQRLSVYPTSATTFSNGWPQLQLLVLPVSKLIRLVAGSKPAEPFWTTQQLFSATAAIPAELQPVKYVAGRDTHKHQKYELDSEYDAEESYAEFPLVVVVPAYEGPFK